MNKSASWYSVNYTVYNDWDQVVYLADDRYIFAALTLIVSVTGIFGGVYCLTNACRNKDFRVRSTALTVNLSISTILLCGIVCPIHAYTLLQPRDNFFAQEEHSGACRLIAFLYFFGMTFCAYAHTSIGINRMFAIITAEYRHMRFLTSRPTTACLILLSWAISGVTYIVPLLSLYGEDFGYSKRTLKCSFASHGSAVYVIAFKIIYTVLPFVIVLLCYLVILSLIVKSKRKMFYSMRVNVVIPERSIQPIDLVRQTRKKKAEIRVTTVAFVSWLVLMLCFLPSGIHGLFFQSMTGLQSKLGQSLTILLWFGCAVNPILYAFLNTYKIKKASGKGWCIQHVCVPATNRKGRRGTAISVQLDTYCTDHDGRKHIETAM